MLRSKQLRKLMRSRERGVSLPEMALGGVVFFTLAFGIIEIGRGMAAYNALSEAVRRGARYAATQKSATQDAAVTAKIQNMVMYGTETAGTSPVAPGLTSGNVFVTWSTTPPFGMNSGWVKVEIKNYSFNFSVPLIGSNYAMRPFVATANAESAGIIPGNI